MRWIIAASHSLDSVVRVSARHLAAHLACGDRHRVLYLPAPISPWHSLLRPGDARFRERRGLWGSRPTPHPTGALQYTPLTAIPALAKRPFDSPWILRQSLRATLPPLGGVIRSAGFHRADVLVVNNPQYAWLDRIVQPKRLVYRCVDDIAGFPNAPRALVEAERDLLKRCDFCVATAENLAEKLEGRGARNVRVIRNGVDLAAYESAASGESREPADMAQIGRPRVIYVGALSQWLDFEWIRRAARLLPKHQFVLIGWFEPGVRESASSGNMHFLGPRPPEQVPAYLASCDAGIIPFKRDLPLVQSVCPVKLYEYLAAGLPVVSSRWREIERIGAPIDLADTAEEFADALRGAPGKAGRSERLAFARENSWRRRFEELERLVLGGNVAAP